MDKDKIMNHIEDLDDTIKSLEYTIKEIDEYLEGLVHIRNNLLGMSNELEELLGGENK